MSNAAWIIAGGATHYIRCSAKQWHPLAGIWRDISLLPFFIRVTHPDENLRHDHEIYHLATQEIFG